VDIGPAQLVGHVRKARPRLQGVLAADELQLAGPGPELEEGGAADEAVPLHLLGQGVHGGAPLHQQGGLGRQGAPGLPHPQPRKGGDGKQERGGGEPERRA